MLVECSGCGVEVVVVIEWVMRGEIDFVESLY